MLLGALLAGTHRPAAAQQALAEPLSAADSAALGARRGAEAARHESTARWVWSGFAGGLVLVGPIGAGASYVAASNSKVALDPAQRMVLLSEGTPGYAWAYEEAFAKSLRERRKRSALVGGALGTAALAAVATTVWAVYYYS
jgi:hypothetical protein